MKRIILTLVVVAATLSINAQVVISPVEPQPCPPLDGAGNVASPQWSNGPNRIFNKCGLVNVGIGWEVPEYRLHVNGTAYSTKLLVGKRGTSNAALMNGFTPSYIDLLHLGVHNSSTGNQPLIRFKVSNGGNLVINSKGGNILMLKNSTGLKVLQLDGSGLLRTREIKVDEASWPDFVFEKTYSIMPLAEVENYINSNKHLPNIPSAIEIKSNGLSLGKMQNLHMQKIEELTIYTIEQDKQITELENTVGKLEIQLKEVEDLENTVSDLQKQLDEIKALLNK